VLALVASAALAACGDDDDGSGASGTFTPRTDDTLTVATGFPSAGFWEGTDVDHITGGFEYELALALADRFGLEKLKVVDLPFNKLVAGKAEGFDLALAQVSTTANRAKVVDLSESYLTTPVGVVSRDGLDIPDLAKAREQRWGMAEATTEVDVVKDLVRPEADVRIYPRTADALAGVVNRQIDVAALDYVRAFAEVAERQGIKVAAQITAPQNYAVLLPKGSSNLEAVDSAIRALKRDGTLDDLTENLYDQFDVDVNEVPTIRVTPR
jgi:polar amino acid transport system substrate-binding protein